MKKVMFSVLFMTFFAFMHANAQHVRVQLNFPSGYEVNAPRNAPYPNAIWIGPEWQWRGGRYVAVPGHWERARRHHEIWIPGHWEQRRRGYFWVPGHWTRR